MRSEGREEAIRMGLMYPDPLPEPAVYYDRPESEVPDVIRLSFSDGRTEIYDRRVKQPSPRKYLNMPSRRRRRKG